MKYFFETYGCQMNVSESNGLQDLLNERGWVKSETIEETDLIIVNTCSVRITAEQRVFGRLGFFSSLKKKKDLKILVMGCMAERLKTEFKEQFPFVDFVVGVSDRKKFTEIFSMLEETEKKRATHTSTTKLSATLGDCMVHSESGYNSSNETYVFSKHSYNEGDFQSFVPIMNGCNNFCTYCIVPYVRGREVSRPTQEVLDEINFLSKKGVKEITLLGQNVNSYSSILNGKAVDFPDLLKLICRETEKENTIKWIRFLSSHPKDLSEKLISVMAAEEKICKSLHLPVQHASDEVLKRMNRKYTANHYRNLVKALRTAMPNLALTTDILIGFPEETDQDLQATLDFIADIEFNSSFMYHYNPREGTKAFDFPNRIPEPVKIERLQRVIDLQQSITEKKMKEFLNAHGEMPITVLVESVSKKNANELFGHTEQGEMVVIKNCSENSIGYFVQVKLEYISGKTYVATQM